MAAVTICSDFGDPKIKAVTVSLVSPSICLEAMGLDVMIFICEMLIFKPVFSCLSYLSWLLDPFTPSDKVESEA